MILKQEYLEDLKEHIRETPEELLGQSYSSFLHPINKKIMTELWIHYQKCIEDYDEDSKTAYANAMYAVLGIDLQQMTDNSNSYTVVFLFTPDGQKTLLVRKRKTSFKGKLNGVGGKIEKTDKNPTQGAIREVREETGARLDVPDLHWLGNITLPYDCKEETESVCELYFYAGIVEKSDVSQQPNEEELVWFNTKDIITTDPHDIRFAGDGDLPYMVNLAVKHFGFDIDTSHTYTDNFEPITHFFQD